MFFEFAYKGSSLRASFDGLLEVVETSRGTVLEGAACFGTIRLSSSEDLKCYLLVPRAGGTVASRFEYRFALVELYVIGYG